MTYPTPEELKQIAIECGFNLSTNWELYLATSKELQSFATRMIEVGRNMKLESVNIEECATRYQAAIRNNTGE